jgi:hypothetical protein
MELSAVPNAIPSDASIVAHQALIWPAVVTENFGDTGSWPALSSEVTDESVEAWVRENKKVIVRTVTWNLCAQPPPSVGDIQLNLLPKDKFVLQLF